VRVRWKLAAIIVFLGIAGGAVAVSIGAFTPTASSATGLLTATAGVADVADEVAATGTVASVESYATAFGTDPWVVGETTDSADSTTPADSDVAWRVTSIGVGVGDVVKTGDVLARAESSDLDAQIEEARRTAKSARLQLVEAKEALEDADGSAQVRQARIALYGARSARANADAALDALIEQRDRDRILAPVDGIVTDVGLVEGTDAPSGAAITIESSTLVVSTSVVESDVASISVDQAATVTITALDEVVEGTVTSIAPSADEASTSGVVSFAITVALAEVPDALRPGMSAEVTIVVASAQDVLTIPSRALTGSGDNYSVRVVAADGTVEVRAVTVGLVTDSLAEIQSGLTAGEAVVTGTSSTDTLGTGGGGFQGGGPGGGFQGGPGGGLIGPGQ
jgi:membrane fusion protein, macrolide-specific efflux system